MCARLALPTPTSGQCGHHLGLGCDSGLHHHTGDPVTRPPGRGRGGHRAVGTEGPSGQQGDMRGPRAAEAFPEVPRRGLRTIRQQAAGVGRLDIRGLPAGSFWPKRRSPEPATGPASGVAYKHRASATLSGSSALPAQPLGRPVHCAVSGPGRVPGKPGAGGGYPGSQGEGGHTQEACPGSNADRAWGWEGPGHCPRPRGLGGLSTEKGRKINPWSPREN